MDIPINFKTIKKVLESSNRKYTIMELSDTHKMLIMEDAGRIFGPFTDDSSVGLSWISQTLNTPESFHQFLSEGNWNIGGDRLWIAPEFPFFTKEREKFNETYTVQSTIDPGHYKLIQDNCGNIILEANLNGKLFEHQYPKKMLYIKRILRKNDNPLKKASSFEKYMKNVLYCGYEQEIYIKDISPEYPMKLEIWDLLQLRSEGTFLIPYLGEDFEYVDYYSPSINKVLTVNKEYAEIKVESSSEHKIGVKAFNTFGRIGYLKKYEDDQWLLLIRNYYNDPSDDYIKEPSDQPNNTGCSLFIYMNDTRGDGFAELETTGRTFESPKAQDSTLILNYWYFFGTIENLKIIIKNLLNITL